MELQFSAHCLILVYFCNQFHENIIDGFLGFRAHTILIGKFSKGHNSVKIVDRVMALFLCTLSDEGLYL